MRRTYFLSKTQAQPATHSAHSTEPAAASTSTSIDSWLSAQAADSGPTHGSFAAPVLVPVPVPVPSMVPMGMSPMPATAGQLCSAYEASPVPAGAVLGGSCAPPPVVPCHLASAASVGAPACASSMPALELCQRLTGQP